MKNFLTLFLAWLIAFSAMAETTLKAKTALSAAGGYVTSQNKVDGSFEDGISSWSASVGTIVKTASTEIQGNNLGVWSGTGTGTLDLQWTATASNTFDANAFVNVGGEDDVYVCAYVGTTETGCKLIPALDKIQKVSVVADSVISSAFYLRLKHTGSDAFSVKVDDGKIEPQAFQNVQVVEQESVSYTGYSSGTNPVVFKTKDTARSNEGRIIAYTGTGTVSRYTVLKPCNVVVTTGGNIASNNYFIIEHRDSSGAIVKQPWQSSPDGRLSIPLSSKANTGDYFVVYSSSATIIDTTTTFFSITATAITDNVIQSYQDGTEWKSLTYQEVNALAGNQGLGTFTAGGVEWKKDGGDLLYKGKLTVGATVGAEARLPLPSSLVTANTLSIPSLQIAGHASYSLNGAFSFEVLIEPSVSYLTFGLQGSTTSALTKSNGSVIFASGSTFSFTARIPIAGWSSSPTLLALPTSKENRFEAEFTASGVATKPMSDVIGNAVVTDTSLYTIPLKAGVFTSAPNASVSINDPQLPTSAMRAAGVVSITPTAVVVRTSKASVDGANTNLAFPFTLRLSKVATDYTAPGVFVGNVAKNQVAYLKDVKASGTNGGGFTSGAWQTRDLNTVTGDSTIVSLATNIFTLQPGEYDIEAEAIGHHVNTHQSGIALSSSSTPDIALGSSEYSPVALDSSGTKSKVMTKFFITTPTSYKIVHRCQTTDSDNGFGNATSFGINEVYTQVKITKLNGQ